MRRFTAAVLGAIWVGNGAFMLAAPAAWFAALPGAADHGPFSPHFVQDVGAAFLAAGLGLVARAWRPALWPAAAAGAAFLGIHAVLHLLEPNWIEFGSVVVPAALSAWAALPGDDSLLARLARRALTAMDTRYDYD